MLAREVWKVIVIRASEFELSPSLGVSSFRSSQFRSFPRSVWERIASEALPQRAGGACKTVRYEAEPRNESN